MKIRVWIRPLRVGSIGSGLSDLRSAQPPEPLRSGAQRPDPLAEAMPGEVLGDLLSRDLQAEERVDTGKVAAQGGGPRGVHDAVAVAGAPELEAAFYVEAP